jgi:prepilin-type N-terminal cleavage/methylation domain-containing protein
MNLNKQKGFTLVEIAIVLVIVGLLIGGVLKGQEMITNAKLKRIESDNAGLAAAMFSYQDRYLQLPGDDGDAQSRFTIYSGVDEANVNGDASGTIEGAWNAENLSDITSAGGVESSKFFAHLRAAGLIPGDGKDATKPTNAYGGQIGIQDGALGISGHVTVFGAIEGPIAQILEARLDDGLPDSGRIQSNLTSEDDMTSSATPPSSYLDGERYDIAFRL